MVFTSDGVRVGVAIRSVERSDSSDSVYDFVVVSGAPGPGPLDCESNVLTTQPHWLQGWHCKTRAKSFCQNLSTCSLQSGDFSRFARC